MKFIKLITPRDKNEDIARQKYLYDMFLLIFIAISSCAFIATLTRHIIEGTGRNAPPIIFLVIVVLLITLRIRSRNNFSFIQVYVFLSIFVLAGTYALFNFGIMMPQGLLLYSLVIAMAGVLLSSNAARNFARIILVLFVGISFMQINYIIHPYTDELSDRLSVKNFIVMLLLFIVIALISWLSSKENEESLRRARKSEADLKLERDLLEARVEERTRKLELAQVNSNSELYKFAEFGKLSSSLIHDLVNPLTAVSLNFNQLADSQKSEQSKNVREGLVFMEQYIQAARLQLRNRSEISLFNVKIETCKVVTLLQTRADRLHVKIIVDISSTVNLLGDQIKFNQALSNLISNAIDAYAYSTKTKDRTVHIKVNENSRSLFVYVSDRGSGIDPTKIDRIFRPFYTTKSADRGTGIGLTITKQIIESDFKGRLSVTSSKRSGTVFTARLTKLRIKSLIDERNSKRGQIP